MKKRLRPIGRRKLRKQFPIFVKRYVFRRGRTPVRPAHFAGRAGARPLHQTIFRFMSVANEKATESLSMDKKG